jgi:hypothetical protein
MKLQAQLGLLIRIDDVIILALLPMIRSFRKHKQQQQQNYRQPCCVSLLLENDR